MPPAEWPLTVLVVDHEPLIRWAISRTLSSSGYHVIEAADGTSAIQALAHYPGPDLVLLEYQLPDFFGLSLLAWIRRVSPRSAVVMMSADLTPEMVQKATELGAYRVMPKPFAMSDIDPVLQNAYLTGTRGGGGRLAS
jgi:two-component system, NtrC family, response regulator PilR